MKAACEDKKAVCGVCLPEPWAVTFVPMPVPMPKVVCRTIVYNKWIEYDSSNPTRGGRCGDAGERAGVRDARDGRPPGWTGRPPGWTGRGGPHLSASRHAVRRVFHEQR